MVWNIVLPSQRAAASQPAAAPAPTATAPSSQAVASAFQSVLGRAPDAEGMNYWTNQLNSGAVSQSSLASAIAAGAQGSDKAAASSWGSLNNLPNIGASSTSQSAPSQSYNTAPNLSSPYANVVMQAYESIGRTGFDQSGSDYSKIDPAGFNYWVNQAANGSFKDPTDFYDDFLYAVTQYNGDQRTGYTPYMNTAQDLLNQLYGAGGIQSSPNMQQPQLTPQQQYEQQMYQMQLQQMQQQMEYQQKLYEQQLASMNRTSSGAGDIGLNQSAITQTQQPSTSYMNTPQTFSRGSAAGMGGVAKRRGWGGMYFA